MDFLHLSDLHYRPGDEYQEKLVEGLVANLQKQLDQGLSPQFVLFTGDIAEKPNIPDVYPIFGDKVLLPILKVLGLDEASVVFCPGNHDVNFDVMKNRKPLYDSLQSARSKLSEIEGYATQSDFLRYCYELSRDFFDMCQLLGRPWDNPLYSVYALPAARCSFVALNGAISCSLEGSKADRGKLSFPVEQALKAVREAEKTGLPLLGTCIHQPLGEFAEEITRGLEPLINAHSKSHHFGHVHQARPMHTISTSGTTLHLQSGALYERKNVFNGYCVVRVGEDRKHKEVVCQTYWKDRFEFDDATDVAPNGRFYSSPEAQTFWKSARPPLTDQQIAEWLKSSHQQFVNENNDTITDKLLDDTFVEPRLTKPAQGGEVTPDTERQMSVKQLMQSGSHVVIAAGNEYGATSLLRHVAGEFYLDGGKLAPIRVPALLDMRKLKSYPAAVRSAIRSALPEAPDGRYRYEALDGADRLVLLLDDFSPTEPVHQETLKTIQNLVPKARLIVIAKIPLLYADHVLPAIELPNFVFLQLRPFDRSRVRKVVQNWKLPSAYVTCLAPIFGTSDLTFY